MATFYNQATLSYNGNIASSNITAGEILENLFVTKTPVNSSYSADRDNSYVISIVNNSSVSYDNVTITDDLGEYVFNPPDDTVVPLTYITGTARYFVNGIPQADPVVTSDNPLIITGISVPAGGNAVIVYSARANSFAPLGEDASITNTATVSGEGFSDISATSTTTPENTAFLSISKSLSPAAVEENGRVTYTFTIQNNGGTAVEVSDDVIFRDDFTPPLTDLTVQFNGALWTEGVNYDYSEATGVFTSLEGQIIVPAATYVQDPSTGTWSVQPGISTLVITGNIS